MDGDENLRVVDERGVGDVRPGNVQRSTKEGEGACQGANRRGVEEGRITAGQVGEIWKGLGARALQMTKVQVSEKGKTMKPTWEDVQTHKMHVWVSSWG